MKPMRVAAVLLALSLAGSGCSVVGVGGSVGSNDWTLVGMTPDEQHLLITTFFGGVASDCTRWEGWEVEESTDRVEIKALLWRKHRPGGCTDDGAAETIAIDLTQPLGDRDLVGCGSDECRIAENQPWLGTWDLDAAITPAGVVVANAGSFWGIGGDGAVLWDQHGLGSGVLNTADDVVVRYDSRGTIGYDGQSGAKMWQITGTMAALANGVVLVCSGEDEIMAAVDAGTGREEWSVEVPCGLVVSDGETIVNVANDRAVDGGYELLLLDASTGDLIVRTAFDDGVNDRVVGFDGAVLAGDRVVVAGFQSDLVVLGLDGHEIVRRPNGGGTPIGVLADVVITAAHDRAAGVDSVTGETLWTSRYHTRLSLAVSGDALWSLDAPAGTVSRLDPRTGEPSWTVPVGATSGFAAAADQRTVYVATSLAVIALDASAGELQWWQHIPFRQS